MYCLYIKNCGVRYALMFSTSLVVSLLILCVLFFFFFNDTATTEIYTLSLHDALPISREGRGDRSQYRRRRDQDRRPRPADGGLRQLRFHARRRVGDRKSTRLNSSHLVISYAVFCLKKKKKRKHQCTVCT